MASDLFFLRSVHFSLAHIFLSATRFFFSECHSCFGGIDHRSLPVEKSLKKIRNITCILQPVSHLVLNYKFSAHTHTHKQKGMRARHVPCKKKKKFNRFNSTVYDEKKNVHGNRKMMSSAHKKILLKKFGGHEVATRKKGTSLCALYVVYTIC